MNLQELDFKRVGNKALMATVDYQRGRRFKKSELRQMLQELSNDLAEEARRKNKPMGRVGMQLQYEESDEIFPASMTDYGENVKLFSIEDSSDRFTRNGEIKNIDAFAVFIYE